MTNTRMSVDEREAFLANVYIGVLSIPCKEGAAPLTVPVWYDYEPGGEVWLITGSQSLKGQIGSKSYREVTEKVLDSVERYWTKPNN